MTCSFPTKSMRATRASRTSAPTWPPRWARALLPDLLTRMAQFELTLLDWAENHKGSKKYVAFADKCWPAFPSQFGFEPCYVNSRLASRGIPWPARSIFTVPCPSTSACVRPATPSPCWTSTTACPNYIYDEDITGKFNYKLTDTFMGAPLRQHAILQDVQ